MKRSELPTGLRRSGSKASSISHSRESLQSLSDSFKTIITTPVIDEDQDQAILGEPLQSLSLLLEGESPDTTPEAAGNGQMTPNSEISSWRKGEDVNNHSVRILFYYTQNNLR
jgi:hypothetical protein